eukprot:3817333-Lingulodinium_polyedra.AAC.1
MPSRIRRHVGIAAQLAAPIGAPRRSRQYASVRTKPRGCRPPQTRQGDTKRGRSVGVPVTAVPPSR